MIEHFDAWQMIHLSPHWSIALDESFSALNSISRQSYPTHWAFSHLKRIFSVYYFLTLLNYCIAEMLVIDLLEMLKVLKVLQLENLVRAVCYID